MRTLSLAVVSLLVCGLTGSENGHLDHYIQVDLGTKYYELELERGTDGPLQGRFSDNLMITPTARIRLIDGDERFGGILSFGLGYGTFRSDDLTVDTVEWHIGLGGSARLARWADLSVMASAGYGVTWIGLPAGQRTWDGESSGAGISGHAEVVAALTVDLWGVLLTANTGYRYTQMTLTDPEHDHQDGYLIHGMVVGVGLGFTF